LALYGASTKHLRATELTALQLHPLHRARTCSSYISGRAPAAASRATRPSPQSPASGRLGALARNTPRPTGSAQPSAGVNAGLSAAQHVARQRRTLHDAARYATFVQRWCAAALYDATRYATFVPRCCAAQVALGEAPPRCPWPVAAPSRCTALQTALQHAALRLPRFALRCNVGAFRRTALRRHGACRASGAPSPRTT
jgi:hypothetical protein